VVNAGEKLRQRKNMAKSDVTAPELNIMARSSGELFGSAISMPKRQRPIVARVTKRKSNVMRANLETIRTGFGCDV